jgi:cell division transport system permease protein
MSQLPRKINISLPVPSFLDKEVMKRHLTRHWQAGVNGLSQLSRTPLTTLITCIVIGIALALPMALFVLLKNIEILSKNYQQSTQLTLYLKQNTSENEAHTLLQTLKNNPAISEVHAVSPAQGLKELREQAGIDDVIIDLNNNPLPWAVVVLPIASYHSPHDLTLLSQTLKQNPEVQSVQLDILWAQRLAALITLAHRFIYALTSFLAMGVLLIVNNCIRSVTEHNKKEINVIKFIGGTNAFIRRPFLYSGVIYGLLGGIIAWQMVDFMLLLLREPASNLAGLYQSQFHLLGIGLADTFFLLFSSVTLGLGGAWFAVTRHLRTSSL